MHLTVKKNADYRKKRVFYVFYVYDYKKYLIFSVLEYRNYPFFRICKLENTYFWQWSL